MRMSNAHELGSYMGRAPPGVPPARAAPAGSAVTRAGRALGGRIVADLVVLEVAGELGSVLVLEQPLEAPPCGVADLLTTALGEIEVLRDLVEIDVPVLGGGFVSLFVFEFVGFRFLAHA